MAIFFSVETFFLVLETWVTGLCSCHMHHHMYVIPVFYIEIGDGEEEFLEVLRSVSLSQDTVNKRLCVK